MADYHVNLALYVAASWALIIAPGPDMLYVITRGISQGRSAGLVSAAGVTVGLLVHTLAAALGLAAILRTSAIAFTIVKYVGAAYLVYLGIKSLRDKSALVPDDDREPMKVRSMFVQGILSNVVNPKVALFFLAFLPQFVDSGAGHVTQQMLLLGVMFALFTWLVFSILGYFAGHFGGWLASKSNAAARLRWVTGSVMIALGVRLAFSDR